MLVFQQANQERFKFGEIRDVGWIRKRFHKSEDKSVDARNYRIKKLGHTSNLTFEFHFIRRNNF